MERVNKDHFKRISLRDEHTHRYQLAAKIANGYVVDCACGIGYSSEIIANKESVESYLGIDPSQEAIDYARSNFSGARINFAKGTLETNSCENSSIDTFLMFETLEHTITPDTAIANIRRLLKPNGLLIGSVPSAEYEGLCEQAYGDNPFHLHRFTRERIVSLLKEKFESVRIFSAEYILGTLIRDLSVSVNYETEIVGCLDTKSDIAGSIIFLAGTKECVKQAALKLGVANKYFPSIPKVLLDRDEVEPIRKAFHQTESALIARDEAIAAQSRMLEDRWTIIHSMEAMIREKDEAIEAQARMLEERWTIMQSMESMIRDRDELIAKQAKLLLKKSD